MLQAAPDINSRDWWEKYFQSSWERNGGVGQSRHFMELLVANLPAAERAYLRTRRPEVLDWGCAFGQGVEVLAEAFPTARVIGLDFAINAVQEARSRYPDREFILSDNGSIPREFDVITTSNCLEHFDEPLK